MNSIDKNIVVISGPSGCGKDTVVKKILSMDERFVLSVSATTRQRRPIETDGVDYIFLSTEEFVTRLSNGEFLEHTCYCDNYYGTLKQQIEDKVKAGKVVVLVIEVEGAKSVGEGKGSGATETRACRVAGQCFPPRKKRRHRRRTNL